MNMMSPAKVYIVAKEVTRLMPGQTVDIDADATVFPAPLSQAPNQVQAVLDVVHTYSYDGRQPGDLLTPVTDLKTWNPLSDSPPILTLSTTVPEPPNPLGH
jgi:hypothetical protein